MPQKVRAYAELLRVSNVLTAVADVWMGMIVAAGSLPHWSISVPLTLASVLLYLSGMVLNDVFDAAKDAQERPTRPIPSGRISRAEASSIACAMMAAGLLCAGVVSYQQERGYPFAVGAILAVCVLLYDGGLKGKMVGPLFMGLCRGANVALGLTALSWLSPANKLQGGAPPVALVIVSGMTIYVMGLTLFARQEHHAKSRIRLAWESAVSLSGVVLLAVGLWAKSGLAPTHVEYQRWLLLWLVVALLIGRRYAAAILQPTPKHIQAAVGNAIQGIILIDAALAFGYADPYWALAIFALLPPTMLMARFIPQT